MALGLAAGPRAASLAATAAPSDVRSIDINVSQYTLISVPSSGKRNGLMMMGIYLITPKPAPI